MPLASRALSLRTRADENRGAGVAAGCCARGQATVGVCVTHKRRCICTILASRLTCCFQPGCQPRSAALMAGVRAPDCREQSALLGLPCRQPAPLSLSKAATTRYPSFIRAEHPLRRLQAVATDLGVRGCSRLSQLNSIVPQLVHCIPCNLFKTHQTARVRASASNPPLVHSCPARIQAWIKHAGKEVVADRRQA